MAGDMSDTGARGTNGEVVDVAEVGDASLQNRDIPGPPSAMTCPECGGALWELGNGRLTKYRCHVGHSYTARGLMAAQAEDLEAALWSALRALEESAALRRRMARRSQQGNWASLAQEYEKQAAEAEGRAELLRRILLTDKDGGRADPAEMAEGNQGRATARRKAAGRPTGTGAAPAAADKPATDLAARKRTTRHATPQPHGKVNGKADGKRSGTGDESAGDGTRTRSKAAKGSPASRAGKAAHRRKR
jgi:hypothetical protein